MNISDLWIDRFASAGTAMLRMLPAETAHDLGIGILASRWFRMLPVPNFQINYNGLTVDIPGIGRCRHPIGLAAGFDKNARAPLGFSRLGLAMLELGTITPRPQPGNPKPRMFRLPDQRALINRMGFNSEGSKVVLQRLQKLPRSQIEVPLGINLGKNKDTANAAAIDDFTSGIEQFQHLADYFVINISSPNTQGLRSLANEEFLAQLANDHRAKRHKLWIKLDPDMSKKDFQSLIEVIGKLGFQGLILTNTHKVDWPEAGGQSGHPLSVAANARLEWAYEVHRGSIPMIASGGILSGLDVLERIIRGAAAVQVYSALVYRGPWAVMKMLRELNAEMMLRGISHLSDVQASYYE
ncbi:MAG: quinone-dependent dihydroorotate dehydrogenase [Oligoflexus sp.]